LVDEDMMTDDANQPAVSEGSSTMASLGRRRLLRLGAVAAPAVVTLSATRAYAQAVGSVTCQANMPTTGCYPRANALNNPNVVGALGSNGLAPAQYCDNINNTSPDLDALFVQPPIPNPVNSTTLASWAGNANPASNERAWITWLQSSNGNGFGGSCLSSVYVSGGVPRI
jgi:hypothetical protein